MEIIVEGIPLVQKKDSSFEYVSENRLFSDSDDYTLSISVPLKDCKANSEIFGMLDRKDKTILKKIFDAEIRDRNFYKSGCVTIVDGDNSEIKLQFLEGRSEQNFSKVLEDIFIDELELDEWPDNGLPNNPEDVWKYNGKCVALPWVNNNSDSGNIQNKVEINNNAFAWSEETSNLSYQPYLLYLIEQICRAIGYSCDLSELYAHDEYKYLLVMNTVPEAWAENNFAYSLPHWNVEEFFRELEKFLIGEFDFNHRDKKITFSFSDNAVNQRLQVKIENVLEEFSFNVEVEDYSCDYIRANNYGYEAEDDNCWGYYKADWFIKKYCTSPNDKIFKKYPDLKALLEALAGTYTAAAGNHRGSVYNKIHHAVKEDLYFVYKVEDAQKRDQTPDGSITTYTYKYSLVEVNPFGDYIVDSDIEDAENSLHIIPASIEFTEAKYGYAVYLQPSVSDSSSSVTDTEGQKIFQPLIVQSLLAGKEDKSGEVYSKLFVAWWDGRIRNKNVMPCPHVNEYYRTSETAFVKLPFSLRLNRPESRINKLTEIDRETKYVFKFISDTIPDARALFNIESKLYVCEKLTATFTEKGMSQLIKGEFYRVKD